MIELIIICSLYGSLVPMVKKKNRSKWLPALAPALWLAGQFVAIFILGIVIALRGIEMVDDSALIQIVGIIGAIVGAGIAHLTVCLLPKKSLTCPKCGDEFFDNSQWGVKCNSCNTKLKVSFNKVSELNIA